MDQLMDQLMVKAACEKLQAAFLRLLYHRMLHLILRLLRFCEYLDIHSFI